MYTTARGLAGRGPALAAQAVFSFSAPALFWSSLLFVNMAALCAFLAALHFSVRRSWPAALGLATLAVLLRYEYAILVGPIAVIAGLSIFHERKDFLPRLSKTFLFPLLGIATLIVSSLALYGTPNFVAVAIGSTKSVEDATTLANTAKYTFGAILGDNIHLNWKTFVVGAGIVPFLLAAVPMARRLPGVIPAVLLGLIAMVVFFIGNSFHVSDHILFGSQTRYLLPAIAIGSLVLARTIDGLLRRGRIMTRVLVYALVATQVAAGIVVAEGDDGFKAAKVYMGIAQEHAGQAGALPPDSVFIGEHLGKILLDRHTVSPQRIPADLQAVTLASYVDEWHADGRAVYVSSHFDRHHANMLQSQGFALAESGLSRYQEVVQRA